MHAIIDQEATVKQMGPLPWCCLEFSSSWEKYKMILKPDEKWDFLEIWHKREIHKIISEWRSAESRLGSWIFIEKNRALTINS